MGRSKSTNRIDLAQIFQHMQQQMLSHLAASNFLEQPTVCGAVTEHHWLELFRRYLPRRYSVSSAFIVDADGRRSRQIDIAIYDPLYTPVLFPHESGLHVPAESVYAIFEVKQVLTAKWIRDAGLKAASVRRLRRTSVPIIAAGRPRPPVEPRPILAGIIATGAVWAKFHECLPAALGRLTSDESLDLGCSLQDGAFEIHGGKFHFSTAGESLIFFMLRLLERLRAMGTAPAADLMSYCRSLQSFTPQPDSDPRHLEKKGAPRRSKRLPRR